MFITFNFDEKWDNCDTQKWGGANSQLGFQEKEKWF
jgi:hypothetical protein